MHVIKLENVSKIYEHNLVILDNINFSVKQNSCVAIVGNSGTGKSTLLHIAGLLDKCTSGNVYFNEENVSSLNDKKLSQLRSSSIGFIFQSHLLLEDFTALENVMSPLLISGKTENAKQKAEEMLVKVGLKDRLYHYPAKLSGGEKQRIAICRALINNPDIILADEPTGSLDEENAKQVEDLLLDFVSENNSTLLLVTHNNFFANRCSEVFEIKNHNLLKVK